jgi:predicted esterase
LGPTRADDVAPANQAEAFNEQLRTAQSKVFVDEFEGSGHDIPWQAHYQIVDKAIKNLKQ